jgi:light-regulated signal transduction histidine kinase (bacteriophytochrome)/CheY-like chemotaxis protein
MRDIHDRLVTVIFSEPDIAHGLTRHQPNLQDYIPSSGVALWLNGSFSALGNTPDKAKIKELANWLDADKGPGVWATDRLPLVWEGGRDMAGDACGVLALSVSRSPRDYHVFWFRPEIIHTVTWAGNPNKPVETGDDGTRLTPRRSFEAWNEQVRLMARPWTEAEITAVQTLRTTLLEVVLQRVDQVARERELSQKRQELLMAELDHRVKNTLANIQALVQYASAGGGIGGESAPSGASEMLNGFTTSFGQRLRAMAHAHGLLTRSRWEGADLRSLLEEEVRPHESHHRTAARTRLTGPEVMLRPKAALALSMAIHELVTNAAKYGALSVPDGTVDVTWALNGDGEAAMFTLDWIECDGPTVSPPTRRGFGRVVIEKSLAYEVDGESRLVFATDGVRCHVRIPVEHVIDAARTPVGTPVVSMTPSAPVWEAEPVTPSRVLLVEDSGLVALQLQCLLEEAGCEVVGPASRVASALKLAVTKAIDAAVLDVDLDGTPSWDVADALTARSIPFMLATGYSADDALPERFRFVPKLLKPFSTEGFNEALRGLLKSP